MNGTVYVALGVVFLAMSTVFYGQAKKPGVEKPQNGRFAGLMFAIAGTGFLVAAAISFFTAD